MSTQPLPEPSTNEPSTIGPRPPAVRTVRSPEDLLALIPTLFGFHPRDSLVLVGVGGAPGVHARVDLPVDAAAAREVGAVLAGAARNVDCDTACLVAYSDHPAIAVDAVDVAAETLQGCGIAVAAALRADATTYAVLREDGTRGEPVPYDVRDHPILAEAVVSGRVVHAHRGELEQTLAPVPLLVAEVQQHAHRWLDELVPERTNTSEAADQRGSLVERVHEEVRWVSRASHQLLAADTVPTPKHAARLLVAMHVSLVARDALWVEISPDWAARGVRLCRHLVQVAPPELRAAPAALLGFASWLAGDGALAWCGVEASAQAEPGYSLAELIGELLERAVPPSTWVPMQRCELGVPGLD